MLCDNSCPAEGNRRCQDGGDRSESAFCDYGTDCLDCGARVESPPPLGGDDDDDDGDEEVVTVLDGGDDSESLLCAGSTYTTASAAAAKAGAAEEAAVNGAAPPSLALKVRGDEGINEALQTYRFLARRK